MIQSLLFSLLFHVKKSCLLSLLITLSHPYVANFTTATELLLPNYVINLTIIIEVRCQFFTTTTKFINDLSNYIKKIRRYTLR